MMNRMADQKDIDIKQSAADQELSAFLTSGGTLQLEWLPSDEAVSKNTALLQREIHQRYPDDPVAWLLFLGFCDRAIALSPSLDFWRAFAGLFARKLRLTPDLEDLRHLADVAVSDEELEKILEKVPAMAGGGDLGPGILPSL